jgi:AcrR family transcriptional regulator
MARSEAREKIIDALIALTSERRWDEVTLESIAERAGVTLAALRGEYDGRISILADFIRAVDEKALSGIDGELAKEAPRERLFDLLFARFEALAPHKQAVCNLGRSARRDPCLALQLNMIATRSMVWMLAASGIPAQGLRGAMRAQALAMIWAHVMRVWLKDDDPGLARTMAALDKHLKEAERAAKRIDDLKRCACRPFQRRDRSATGGSSAPDLSEAHPS